MSMKISLSDLDAVREAISKLEEIKGITVRQISVAGHTVFLDFTGSEGKYVIVGITNGKTTYRDTV